MVKTRTFWGATERANFTAIKNWSITTGSMWIVKTKRFTRKSAQEAKLQNDSPVQRRQGHTESTVHAKSRAARNGRLFPIWKLKCVHVTTKIVMRRAHDRVTWSADVARAHPLSVLYASAILPLLLRDTKMWSLLGARCELTTALFNRIL